MTHPDDEDDELFPPEDRDPSPFTCRVAELLRSPGVGDRWQQRCRESLREYQQRFKRRREWDARHEKAIYKLIKRAHGPTARLTELDITEQVRICQLADRPLGEVPFAGGPLPVSHRHPLSLADCYFVLALVHNSDRRSGRIEAFADDDQPGQMFYHTWLTTVRELSKADQLTLGDCLARVEADLDGEGLITRQIPRTRRTVAPTATGRPPDPVKAKVTTYVRVQRGKGKPWKDIVEDVVTKFGRRYSAETLRSYHRGGGTKPGGM